LRDYIIQHTKNVNDEYANKLKLIAYNSIMATNIYDKIKVTTGISMTFGSATLTPKSLLE